MKLLGRLARNRYLLIYDFVLTYLSYMLTFVIGYNIESALYYTYGGLVYVALVALIQIIIMYAFGIYKIMWYFSNTKVYAKFIIAFVISAIVSRLIMSGLTTQFVPELLGIDIETIRTGFTKVIADVNTHRIIDIEKWRIPRCLWIKPAGFVYKAEVIARVLMLLLMLGMRMGIRVMHAALRSHNISKNGNMKQVLIYGAGNTGMRVLKETFLSKDMNYKVVGLIDDDKIKRNFSFGGLKVLGGFEDVPDIVKRFGIDRIVIAIPSMSVARRKEIVEMCNKTGCIVKIVPGFKKSMIDGKKIPAMRNVDIEDLLAREPIKLNNEGISKFVTDKTVMVTGGGGSIGSELCRQIIKFKPKMLVILDIYENSAYDLQNELKYNYPDQKFEVVIASVRDKERLNIIFDEYKPEVVFHAAAHKHVPLMEVSPGEAVKNNIFGTYNVARCADEYGVQRFVMISTDKAVNPTNVMGATKRMCEKIVQSMQSVSKTQFVAVRFGNVLGSNGSVIPLFKRQIENGGPLTVTHKDITRYFMTIPEAAQLVIQAASNAKGGEIFVLDMGAPVKIYDLAENLIRLAGYTPGVDMDIKITGLRPGEKLYEELLMDEEGLKNTVHDKIFIGQPIFSDMEELKSELEILRKAVETGDNEKVKIAVAEVVPTYHINADDFNSAREAELKMAK